MFDMSDIRWKYLRENSGKYFDPARNTILADYLSYMFQNNTFVYDSYIPKDIILRRRPDADIRKFRPDARCEELNLIVEFDGVAHYQDPKVVLSDQDKDIYLQSLGYIVVRIPYWIQLSNSVIHELFRRAEDHLTIGNDPMCTLDKSFYDVDKDSFNLSSSVGAMCYAGQKRFLEELSCFNIEIQIQVYWDIFTCCECAAKRDIPLDYVIPPSVMDKWGIDELVLSVLLDDQDRDLDIEKVHIREQILFNQNYSDMYYAEGELRQFYTNPHMLMHLRDYDMISIQPDVDPSVYAAVMSIIDALSKSDYMFDVTGVALSPTREDYATYITGFNLYLDSYEDEMMSKVYELEDVCKPLIDAGKFVVDYGIAPAGNVHVAVYFS